MNYVLRVASDTTECIVQQFCRLLGQPAKKEVLVVQPKACMSSNEYLRLALNSLG